MNDEERNKKERKRSIFKRFDIPTLPKVSGILQVVLHLDSEVVLVYGHFVLLIARLGVRAPITYVQDAILNLRHPYIVVATATTDTYIHTLHHNNYYSKKALKCKPSV